MVALAEENGSRLEVYDIGRLNEDNTQGKLLGTADLSTEQEVTELAFATEGSLSDVSFRIVYGGSGVLNVTSLYLVSTERMYTDVFWLMGAVLLISAVLLVRKARGKQFSPEGRTAFLLLLAAVLLSSAPLGYEAVLDGNDLYYQFKPDCRHPGGVKKRTVPGEDSQHASAWVWLWLSDLLSGMVSVPSRAFGMRGHVAGKLL